MTRRRHSGLSAEPGVDAEVLGDIGQLDPTVLRDPLALVAAAVRAAVAEFSVLDGEDVHLVGGDSTDRPGRAGPLVRSAVAAAAGRAVEHVTDDRATATAVLDGAPSTTLAAVAVDAPSGRRLGALVVRWNGHWTPGEAVWRVMERAARHLTMLLTMLVDDAERRRSLELSPDPVLVLDTGGAIERANVALASLLGFDAPEDLVGSVFLELLERHDRARVATELGRLQSSTRRTRQFDVDLAAADGRTVPASISAVHPHGTHRQLHLVVHDLTERAWEEEQRARLSEQLARAQRLDAIGQVAGGFAHDLNNLLAVMLSNVALARESLRDVGQPADLTAVHEDLDELDVAVERASALTAKLLQFARREHGLPASARVPDVLDAVSGMVASSLPARVRLVREVLGDLPPVASGSLQLERALLNLVLNARDAVGEQGTIRIRASLGQTGASIGRRWGAPGGQADDPPGVTRAAVCVQVSDDGAGMERRTLARAFEPLFTTKSDDGGTGLGLPSVLAFVDEVDGSVELESEPGVGTTVTLLVPVLPDDAGVPVGVDVPVAGARILLVDPADGTRRVIARMLDGAGYRVVAVGSGEDAVERLEADPVDLVVTELALPGIDGVELVQWIQDRALTVGVVAVTSVDGPGTLQGIPMLVKPFSHARLLRTVASAVGAR